MNPNEAQFNQDQDERIVLKFSGHEPAEDVCCICGKVDDENHACMQDVPASTRLVADARLGTVVAGHYELLSEIAEGGMSIVYKARHQLLGTIVAVKVLRTLHPADPVTLTRFRLEAQAISRLENPNIVRLLHFELPTDGEPVLVMEYVDGKSLDQAFQGGEPDLIRFVNIFGQVCEALAHAHDQNIVHRDLKPSNIMICTNADGSETVKIVDFGIAKPVQTQELTRTGEMVGSPLYMSPEQCRALPVGPSSDIYSLACVMFEAIAGRPPFVGATALNTMHMHLNDVPERLSRLCPEFPQGAHVDAIVYKALAKDPARRYQNVRQLREDLLRLLMPAERNLMMQAATELSVYRRQHAAAPPSRFATARLIFMTVISTAIIVSLVAVCFSIATKNSVTFEQRNLAGQKSFDLGNYTEAKSQFTSILKDSAAFPSLDPSMVKIAALAELVDLADVQHDSIRDQYASELQKAQTSYFALNQEPEEKLQIRLRQASESNTSQSDLEHLCEEVLHEAQLCFRRDDIAKAETLCVAAVKTLEKHNLTSTEPYAGSLQFMATLARQKGDVEGGIALLHKAGATAANMPGQRARILTDLADMKTATGYGAEALDLSRQAVKLSTQFYGTNSSRAARAEAILGSALANQAQSIGADSLEGRKLRDEAQSQLNLALETFAAAEPPDVDGQVNARIRLIDLYLALANPRLASEQLKVLNQVEASEPKNFESWLQLTRLLEAAAIVDSTDTGEHAEPFCARARAIIDRIAPKNSALLADNYFVRGRLARFRNKDAAIVAFKNAIVEYKKAFGESSAILIPAYEQLASTLMDTRDYVHARSALEAESTLLRSHPGMTTQRAIVKQFLKICDENLSIPSSK